MLFSLLTISKHFYEVLYFANVFFFCLSFLEHIALEYKYIKIILLFCINDI